MSENYIHVEADSLENAVELLNTSPEKVSRAFRSAVLRARGNVRANSTKEIAKEYAIRQTDIRAEQNIRMTQKYTGNDLVANIIYSGSRIPMARFDISPKTPVKDMSKERVTVNIDGNFRRVYPGKPLWARVKRNESRTKFKNAFTARMKSGHIAAVERRTTDADYNGRLPLGVNGEKKGQFYGPSVSQILDNLQVKEALTEGAQETFQKRFSHEIDRMIAGWGENRK